MSPSDSIVGRRAPPESACAQQLARGYGNLRFAAELELEFRAAYRSQVLNQLRINLWLAVVFVLAFSWFSQVVLQLNDLTFGIIHGAVFVPLLLGALAIVYSPLYARVYSAAAQVGAPIFGITVVVLEIMASQAGSSLISTVVIAVFFTYLMLGMLFYAALRSALIIVAAYVALGLYADLPSSELGLNIAMLVLANLIGGTVCFTLERANRTNYLESSLLIEVASRDGLTGISNRRAFDEHLQRVWQQAARDRVPLALLLIDIDHFKAFNDYYGHQAGDECLKRVAWSLMECVRRPLDITARYGGEEFAIVLYDAQRGHVEELARQIQGVISSLNIPHAASGVANRVTVSVGAACVQPVTERSHLGFIQLADQALYAAKGRGRNCVVVMDNEYDDLTTGAFCKNDRPCKAC